MEVIGEGKVLYTVRAEQYVFMHYTYIQAQE